ncbi:hypothetical protein Pint_29459 [Pistacia integerrima]|uniref:Uncharacterized protein n=1 Tax=Pistacia integerrima TaxID=434235 RepID=A0ACC0X1T9_9ROSI|nr:hypothetical protein Pint_29459 [Pistacia integerrima]
MKPYSIAMAFVLLLLSLILSTWLSRAQAEGRPIAKVSTMATSSRSSQGSAGRKETSFQEGPNPPLDGEGSRKQQ